MASRSLEGILGFRSGATSDDGTTGPAHSGLL